MPRAVDLQLLGWALLAGALVAAVGQRVLGRRVGPATLVAAWLLTLLGERLVLGVVVPDLSAGMVAWSLAAAVALGASRGVTRVCSAGPAGERLAVRLALVSAGGVWAGVPETSVVLLVAGAVVGALSVGVATGRWPASGATIALVGGLAAAVAVGAEGDRHALAGGLLCFTTFLVLGVRPPGRGSLRPVDGWLAVLLHGASALVAARQIGVSSSWGLALVAGPAVVVLSVLAAGMVGRPQSS